MLERVDILRRRLVRAMLLDDDRGQRSGEIQNARFYYYSLVDDVCAHQASLRSSSSNGLNLNANTAPPFDQLLGTAKITSAGIARFCAAVRKFVNKCTVATIEELATSTSRPVMSRSNSRQLRRTTSSKFQNPAGLSDDQVAQQTKPATQPETTIAGRFSMVSQMLDTLQSSIRNESRRRRTASGNEGRAGGGRVGGETHTNSGYRQRALTTSPTAASPSGVLPQSLATSTDTDRRKQAALGMATEKWAEFSSSLQLRPSNIGTTAAPSQPPMATATMTTTAATTTQAQSRPLDDYLEQEKARLVSGTRLSCLGRKVNSLTSK